MEEEEILESFLGDRPRAGQLADWSASLKGRLVALRHEASRPDADPKLGARIKDLERQIAELSEQLAITEFVEDSVKVTLRMGAVSDVTIEGS